MENFIFCAVSMTKETINKAYNSALSREGSRGHAAHKMELIVTVVNNCCYKELHFRKSYPVSASISYKSLPQVVLVYLFILYTPL